MRLCCKRLNSGWIACSYWGESYTDRATIFELPIENPQHILGGGAGPVSSQAKAATISAGVSWTSLMAGPSAPH